MSVRHRLSRLPWSWLLLLPALFLAGSGAAARPSDEPAPHTEPRLALRDLEGRERDLAEYRGRIVVVNFWATFCIPCLREMPAFETLRDRYADRGVQFVAPSADDEDRRDLVVRFVEREKLEIPVWVGATILDQERFGLGNALPATAIVDRDGRVAFRVIGIVQPGVLEERLDWLLGDRASSSLPPLVGDPGPADHGHESGDGHDHHPGEEHEHGVAGLEGASLVPS